VSRPRPSFCGGDGVEVNRDSTRIVGSISFAFVRGGALEPRLVLGAFGLVAVSLYMRVWRWLFFANIGWSWRGVRTLVFAVRSSHRW